MCVYRRGSHCMPQHGSDSQSNGKHTNDAVHGAILPSDRAASVSGGVPVTGVGRVESCATLLHDSAVNDVFKSFPLFNQLSERVLDDARRPLVHLVLAVVHTSDYTLDALFNRVTRVVRTESNLCQRKEKKSENREDMKSLLRVSDSSKRSRTIVSAS